MDQVEVLLGQSTRQPLVNLLGLHPLRVNHSGAERRVLRLEHRDREKVWLARSGVITGHCVDLSAFISSPLNRGGHRPSIVRTGIAALLTPAAVFNSRSPGEVSTPFLAAAEAGCVHRRYGRGVRPEAAA